MSNVKLNDRNESKVEFDNTYFTVYNDAVNLIRINFGCKKEEYTSYLKVTSSKVYAVVYDIGTHIRIANSIYPKTPEEYGERRVHQSKAIGLCYDLLTKYQLIMTTVGTKDDKYFNILKGGIWYGNDFK